MSLGIKNVKIARVDKDGHVIVGADGIFSDATDKTGVFTADQDTAMGVASVAFANLAGTLTGIYGSDKLVYQASGKGAPTATVTINALPNEIKQAVLGNKADGKGGFTISGKGDANNRIALLVESRESFDDSKPIYVSLYMSAVTEAASTMTSNNASENRSQDALLFTAVERNDDGFGKFYFASAKGFDADAMQKDVFVPASTTPTGGQ